jgi:peptidase S51-like protein
LRPSQELSEVVDDLPPDAGTVGLLSSDECTEGVEDFDRELIASTGPRVCILLCADPDGAPRMGPQALAYYRRLGAQPEIGPILHRADARADALPKSYDLLFLCGGSPLPLLAALRNTAAWRAIVRRWRRGAGLAGASAGAMALCRDCLIPDEGADRPTRWARGLGPLARFGLAVHASSRPEAWLAQVAMEAPRPVIAIDDFTGLLLTPGRGLGVFGPGRAWIAGDPGSVSSV